jgi:hypothetical protein
MRQGDRRRVTPTPPGLPQLAETEVCWSDAAAFPERAPDEDPQPGDVRDYRLGLRWRRLDQTAGQNLGAVPPICWDFDEREWNVGADHGYGPIPAMACGNAVTHVYETASWGKPANGPRFLPPEEACPAGQDHCCEQVPDVWNMPSYQVRVYTTWAAEWAIRWEQYERVGSAGECQCHGGAGADECRGEPGLCTGAGEHWVWIEDPVYEWVEHVEPEWETLDLRQFGNGTWYYTSWAVVTTGAGPWCNWEYADPDPGDAVRVPVIEAQSVLRDPCVRNGTCP